MLVDGRNYPLPALQNLLGSTERIVQEIDSVEYGLTDIQEYYANTGALKKAAETTQAKNAANPAARADGSKTLTRRVGVSVVEAYGKEVRPRELDATLRIEYRSKLLNPKWAEAMAKQASYVPGRNVLNFFWILVSGGGRQRNRRCSLPRC